MIPWLAYPLIVWIGTVWAFADMPKPPHHPTCDPTVQHCT